MPRQWDADAYEGSLAQRAVDRVFGDMMKERAPKCEDCRKDMEWSNVTNSWLCFRCRKEVMPRERN